ncbi:MAG: RtcB family protein [Rhodanobacteraceae bacterium]|nr:RtcB family protein [Rhodanobacteraceae bacterium]MBK7042904.1 RtcB family protein [Rhodanobacteraceae bacterium]MBP9153712.1 RtcB family protein [Xanthomonadales bacterium]HQW81097.1 RtcB family protein [Pseudomonadota bacterium]
MFAPQHIAVPGAVPIKLWTQGVPVEDEALQQVQQVARLPIVWPHIAVMPDVHVGIGVTVGSVVPTHRAIIPAAVGVDIGCGMIAARTSLHARDLPDSLAGVRSAIEQAVPHGRTTSQGRRDKGAWRDPPKRAQQAWSGLDRDFRRLCELHPRLTKTNHLHHLGTLGTGNHFVEICLDQADAVWVMLHSGSRGVGNAIGTHFIALAQADMRAHIANLPHRDLAYFEQGSTHFDEYLLAVDWAQRFARENRAIMLANTLAAMKKVIRKPFQLTEEAVNCHHNYVQRERHFGETLLVTRKGAMSAQKGQFGIIPGSMGANSFIVRGLGNQDAFCSCSHGAGRVMSRTRAKQLITLDEHVRATAHVECRKDNDVIDESPAAYKPIDAVMAAQRDLVEIVHTLKQVVCVKG